MRDTQLARAHLLTPAKTPVRTVALHMPVVPVHAVTRAAAPSTSPARGPVPATPMPKPVISDQVVLTKVAEGTTAVRPVEELPFGPRAPLAPPSSLAGFGSGSAFTFAAFLVAALISFFCLAYPRAGRRLRPAIDLLRISPAVVPLEHPG